MSLIYNCENKNYYVKCSFCDELTPPLGTNRYIAWKTFEGLGWVCGEKPHERGFVCLDCMNGKGGRKMKKVYICSRYRADENHTVSGNIRRAFSACGHALDKGYAPFAPHLIYPECLDDSVQKEREIGITAGLSWLAVCDELWQWGATVSEGMATEIAFAHKLGIPVRVFNSIGIPKEQWNHVIEFISYDGKYPNLCSGTLVFSFDGQERSALYVLRSTGSIKPNYEGTNKGSWELERDNSVFVDFTEKDFDFLEAEINRKVPLGCCGGCI